MDLKPGTTVTIVARVQNNLLPDVFPNAPMTDTYTGVVQKRASYDKFDTVRVLCARDRHRVRVISLKNIVSVNGNPFLDEVVKMRNP